MNMLASARRGRLSRWAGVVLGIASILVGATLVTRPFQSLAVLVILVAAGAILTGIDDLTDKTVTPIPRTTIIIALGWIVLGFAILLWAGLSLRTLTVMLGLALVVSGVARVWHSLRGATDQRIAALLLGIASIILGCLALLWPDITLLVVAVVFGVRVFLFGLARIIDVLRARTTQDIDEVQAPAGRLRGYIKTAGAAVALLLSCLLVIVSLRLHAGTPVVDAFYTPPADVPTTPGALLRTATMQRAIPPAAQAWRILYTTTRTDGVPAVATALVVAPANLPATPLPVIAWAHGTTGVAEACAPSVLNNPFESGAMPAIDQVIANGWAVVATDYTGLGTTGPHAYLVAQQAGRAVLDAVRAARQMPELDLADQTVIWGHSQGGGAALWTGILAPTYAMDTNVIGVAALAPASDLPGLVGNLDVVPGGAIFASYIIQGYSDTYADVRFNTYVRPTARILVREMASRCLAEPEVFVSVLESLTLDTSIWGTDPTSGAFGTRLQENVPNGPIPAPLFVGQGLTDELVLPSAQEAFVKARCATGGTVDYRTYAGFDHVGVVGEGSPLVPDLLAWTQERLEGRPAVSNC